ncbi:MAG TPA: hypothetical protein VFU11_07675 [Solirubrobacterales bacterium]|nr:hypothetical protein [Solirubrobacterales bacterium]
MSKNLLYGIAYDEAVRARSEQQELIESLRARAGLLFSVAAISTSFLGAQALRAGRLYLPSWLALLCFIAVASVSLAILWPRKWEGATDPREVIETYIEAPKVAPVEELQRDLSIYIYGSYKENQEALRQLAAFLQVGSGLMALEVAFWMIAIAAAY